MNGQERSALPSDVSTPPPAPIAGAPAGAAGGWRTRNDAGTMTSAQSAAMVSCAPRQSCTVKSQLANGATIMGAMPTPADVSETASARCLSNQLLTTAMNGGKKLPAAKPTISP